MGTAASRIQKAYATTLKLWPEMRILLADPLIG